ncbi:RHS repeat-associated core domain-containing protein [Acinetobacter oleivorans]|uniref:RHS repeat-associated core domain-containing protein n=1 Tax=Acinetobacter oleivorans TaxID=1148157 RepID=UPI0011A2AD3C|nr:RHS repeat-associated core domain-containing protein [Acinetobacter oleivorans]
MEVFVICGAGAGKTNAVLTDRNATPRMLVDNSTNTAVWQWESNAFGAGLPTDSVKFNLRFPGQYYDEFTGLHYNLNRYYNPELGRYYVLPVRENGYRNHFGQWVDEKV